MKLGTPGFIGSRLTEAREARGLTKVALAELIGVTRQAITEYENGKYTPQLGVTENLSQILRLPLRFFFIESHPPDSSEPFFRSLSAATKRARLRAKRKYEWTRHILFYLEQYLELPDVQFPAPRPISEMLNLDDQEIEEEAWSLRDMWDIGAGVISNVTLLLENKGAIIVKGNFDSDRMDAYSRWLTPIHNANPTRDISRPFVFLEGSRITAVRHRFNIAHELAHILFSDVQGSRFHRKPEIHKEIEKKAYQFAGAFLLPAESFAAELSAITLESLLIAKEKWMVSVAAMLMRARVLGLISEGAEEVLWKQYNSRGWKRLEPLDDQLISEEPSLLRKAIDLLIESGTCSYDDIRVDLPFRLWEVEDLLGLPKDYLTADRAYDEDVVSLRNGDDLNGTRAKGKSARILQFPGSPIQQDG